LDGLIVYKKDKLMFFDFSFFVITNFSIVFCVQSAVLLVVSIWGGTAAIKNIHDRIRKAAFEKAATGLPSLVEMNKGFRQKKKQ
jgi:hypothetical protein